MLYNTIAGSGAMHMLLTRSSFRLLQDRAATASTFCRDQWWTPAWKDQPQEWSKIRLRL